MGHRKNKGNFIATPYGKLKGRIIINLKDSIKDY